jgi:hypothetical protein
MRTLLLAATSLLFVSGLAGCTAKGSAPTPSSTASPGSPALAQPNGPEAALAPAIVVYTGKVDAYRVVGAALEDGSKMAVTLSAAGVDTSFAGVLPGRRALLAEYAADGAIAALASIGADGTARVALGALPAGRYRAVTQIKTADDAVVAELARAGVDGSDVVVLRAGAEPRVLAAGATLVSVALGRAAFSAGGNVQSVKLDGTGLVALGAGDGHDRVAEARAEKLLLTVHLGAGDDVRVIGIDGVGKRDLGKPDLDETAVAITAAQRLVYLRATAAGAVLVSASIEGADEQVLTAPELDARPIQVTAEGQILFGDATGALRAVSAAGGPARVLDPAAGSHVRLGTVQGGHVIYVSDTPHWPALRVAGLDGSGVVSLCETIPWVPFFSGLMADGRVVFYRSLSGQLEGGRVYSVKLDGSELRPVGGAVSDLGGKALAGAPSDQDFEAITPSGRLILEAEFESNGGGPQLTVGAADSDAARMLTELGHPRFAAVIP